MKSVPAPRRCGGRFAPWGGPAEEGEGAGATMRLHARYKFLYIDFVHQYCHQNQSFHTMDAFHQERF
ncbi:hypothetical protein [Achromobacter aloeverae]